MGSPDRREAPSPAPGTAVLKYAIASRSVVLALIFLCRGLLSPYDTSSLLNPPCLLPHGRPSPPPPERHRIGWAIHNGVVWDKVYFVRIAECGYEYEEAYDFLPLLPLSIRLFSRTVMTPLVPLVGHRAVLALAGYFISNIAFVLAAVYFYRLSVVVLKDHNVAFRASVLFCFNPASIFYSSIYSESLYALFSVGGLYYVVSGTNNIAVFWFALSGCARSNGVLNAGYFCFHTMHQFYDAFIQRRSTFVTPSVSFLFGVHSFCFMVRRITVSSNFLILFSCPSWQENILSSQCSVVHVFLFHLSLFKHTAITISALGIPLMIGVPGAMGKYVCNYTQSHYWGVGFMRYFQLKQLPNFLLASPILSLALCSIVHYVSSEPIYFHSLGFQASKVENTVVASSLRVDEDPRSENEPSDKRFTSNNSLRRRKQLIKEGDPAMLGFNPLDGRPTQRK